AMRVQGPDGAGDEPVIVEYAKRAEAHVSRVVVHIEREVPPGMEPAARRLVDLRVATNLDHGEPPRDATTTNDRGPVNATSRPCKRQRSRRSPFRSGPRPRYERRAR